MRLPLLATLLIGCAFLSAPAHAAGADKLYRIACGEGHADDQSRWSPGVKVGQPLDVVDTCYLIHHPQGWLLWDTGITDAIFGKEPDPVPPGGTQWRRAESLKGELEKLGVKPADIKFLAISHTHPDHIGNVELFPNAMLLVQKLEYDWPTPFGVGRFKPEHPVTKLAGDHDVFGDGSVTILSTPGHTPGHQSLLVKLPQTGAIILSGDAAHFRDNFDQRRIPTMNVDKDLTIASMQRLADIMAKDHAQLWINHDKAQAETLKYAPAFYE